MNGIILFLIAGLGIQTGWQQTGDGTVEYIVQVDEAGLAALEDGLPLTSAIPAELGRVDRIRIQIGTSPLPRTAIASQTSQKSSQTQTSSRTTNIDPTVVVADLQRRIKLAGEPQDLTAQAVRQISAQVDTANENAQLAIANAADQIPVLVRNFVSAPANQSGNPNGSFGTQTQSSQQPASSQQQYNSNNSTTVRNSTTNQQYQTSQGSASPTSYNQSGGQYGASPRMAQSNQTQQWSPESNERIPANNGNFDSSNANNQSTQQPAPQQQSVMQQAPPPQTTQQRQTGQTNYDSRQIGPYQQPASKSGFAESNQTNSMDSRNGQQTFQNQPPSNYSTQDDWRKADYQNAFSAGQTQSGTTNPNYSNADMNYEMDEVRSPNSRTRTNPYAYEPNWQFNNANPNNGNLNSGYPQRAPNTYATNTNPQQPNNQFYPNSYQQEAGSAYAPNPYATPFGQSPQNLSPLPNPYAPGYPPQQPWPYNLTGYSNPYQPPRTDAEEEGIATRVERLLEERLKKLEQINEKPTPASLTESTSAEKSNANDKTANPQWLTALVFLFGSVGLNFYLAWIALSFYHRYRTMSEEMRENYLERIESR